MDPLSYTRFPSPTGREISRSRTLAPLSEYALELR
jgi:hypothetical protein